MGTEYVGFLDPIITLRPWADPYRVCPFFLAFPEGQVYDKRINHPVNVEVRFWSFAMKNTQSCQRSK